MTSFRYSIVLSVVGLVVAPTAAQQLDSAGFVRNLYQRYSGTDPDRGTVDVWVRELSKGTSPTEVHAQILGSTQAFDHARRSNEAWVRMLYVDLLGREPDAAGYKHWLARLAELRYDRVKLAREFLKSAGAEIAAGGGNRPGVIPPGDLPGQLKATGDVLAQAVGSEFPGFQYFMLRSQAESFGKAVVAYTPVLNAPNRDPQKFATALQSLSNTLDALERGVAQSRLPAPNTRLHAGQCRQLLVALGQVGGGLPPQPPVVAPPGGGGWLTQAEAREYRRLLDEVSKEVTAAEATFRVVIPSGWATTRLLNQVDAVAAEVDSLRSDLRSGTRRDDLGTRVHGIQASVNSVSQTLSTGRVDVRALQAWYSVSRSLESISGALALGRPPGPGGRVPVEVFRAIDQTVAECDALLVSFSPYATYNRSVARLTTDLTDLKNRYAALRRSASLPTVSRRDLDGHLESIEQRMRTVGTNWREATRDPRLTNAPDLIDLQSADRDLTKLIATIK